MRRRKRRRKTDKLVAALVVGSSAAIVWIVLLGLHRIHPNPVNPPIAASMSNDAPASNPTTIAEALRNLEAFFEAPDLASKALHVRDPQRVVRLMENYHIKRSHPFPTLGRVSPGRMVEWHTGSMVLFEVEPFDGPRFPVAMIWNGKRHVVDWESLTAYGTIDWAEFLETMPQSPQTLRVFIRGENQSQLPPGTTSATIAFRIEHRDDPQPLVAIAKEPLAKSLLALTENNRRTPVTLKIAWLAGTPTTPATPMILELIAEGWSPG